MPRTETVATTFGPATARDGRACARGTRCTSATVDPETGHHEPAYGPRALCDPDRDLLERAIGQLPRMYVRVHQALLIVGAGAGGPKVSTSKSPPIPLNTGADELLRLMAATLVSWEERVREVARLALLDTELSRRRRDSVALDQAARILAPRVDALLALQAGPMVRDGVVVELDGADAALEVFGLHWRCRAALTDSSSPAEPLSAWCQCGLRRLARIVDWEDRPDGARCLACGAAYSQQELGALTSVQAVDARQLAAARVAAHQAQREELQRARAAELAIHHVCRGDVEQARRALVGLSVGQRGKVAQAAGVLARLAADGEGESDGG